MKTKLEILDEYKKGSKLSDIARRRGLNASTVHYIINQVIYFTPKMTHNRSFLGTKKGWMESYADAKVQLHIRNGL